MDARRKHKRRFALAGSLLTIAASAAAIPPYPPAQKGSKASTYNCGSDVLVFTESWNYSVSRERRYEVFINGKDLSDADAEKITQEIASSGPFQANYAVCANSGFELILLRYTPTEAQLRLGFNGGALSRVGVSDASTGFKLNYRPSTK